MRPEQLHLCRVIVVSRMGRPPDRVRRGHAASPSASSIRRPTHLTTGIAKELPKPRYLGPSAHSLAGFHRYGTLVYPSGTPMRRSASVTDIRRTGIAC